MYLHPGCTLDRDRSIHIVETYHQSKEALFTAEIMGPSRPNFDEMKLPVLGPFDAAPGIFLTL